MNSALYAARYILLKAKLVAHNRKITWKVEKAAKETETTQEKWAHHGRGSHHCPWFPPRAGYGGLWPVRLHRFSNTAFCACFEPWILPWIVHIGPFGLVLLALFTWLGLDFMLFS